LPDGVLITRPEPGAAETAARIAALGYRPIVTPLMEIYPQRAALPPSGDLQAILATSANAIPALPESHRHLPLYAVGEATASRARTAGFSEVSSADGDSVALAVLVAQSCQRNLGPLLFACGKGQGMAFAADLRTKGFSVVRRVVYAAAPVAALPAAARAELTSGNVTAALFFSADTARHCVRLLQHEQLHETVRTVDALAIGQRAGMALQALPWRRTRVAAQPNQDAMLALLR
jgi:uroporphyrinogen-III synthase